MASEESDFADFFENDLSGSDDSEEEYSLPESSSENTNTTASTGSRISFLFGKIGQGKNKRSSKKKGVFQKFVARASKAFKQTLVYLGVLAVLMVASYILSKTKFSQVTTSQEIVDQWKRQIFDRAQFGEPLLRFLVTLVISVGALLKVLYCSYGLASLPVFLVRGGKRSLEDEREAVGRGIETVRENLRAIQEKYMRSQKQVSMRDKQALCRLRREEKALNMKESRIQKSLNRKRQTEADSGRLI